MLDDLRGFIEAVEQLGECKRVENADWNLEIGSIAEVAGEMPNQPMLLFDPIKGYPKGYRIITNAFATPRRMALAMDFPEMTSEEELVRYWRKRLQEDLKPVPPIEVKTGPVMENVLTGDEVDLFKFPVPKWHKLDGGRYIGTGDTVIMRDPDEGWINLGVFRTQIHDKKTATIYISPGHHGRIIREKYWAMGKPCPVVVTCGQAPIVFFAAGAPSAWGSSEYDYAGWLRNKPVEVVKGIVTGLPIPATAEIALEGEIVPPEVESRDEGPFGEWTGYYASNIRPEAACRVKAILHRNNPIILACPPFMNLRASQGGNMRKVAELWNELESLVPGIKKVWALEDAKGLYIPVVSVKQMYPGHAKQVGLAVTSSRAAAYHGRFVIVVDDDIDPNKTSEVLWALATRCDPATALEIVTGC